MRIGPENSVYSVFLPKVRATFSVADEAVGTKNDQQPRKSEAQLTAELYESSAQQHLDADDINKDGLLSKDEYMAGQRWLAAADNRVFDLTAEEERWSKFDPTGKGAIDRNEIIEGLKIVLPVTAHYIDPDVTNAIVERAREAAEGSKPDFKRALQDQIDNPSIVRSIQSLIAEQVLGIAGSGEAR